MNVKGEPEYIVPPAQQRPPRRHLSKWLVACILVIYGCVMTAWKFIPRDMGMKRHGRGSDDTAENFQWKESSEGIFHSTISLPLDYSDPSVGNVTVALAKFPASNQTHKLGSILINPGGPGGSGTQFVYRVGRNLSDVVDGRYDIIGFDPRGINQTSPQFLCTQGEQRSLLNLQSPQLLNTHNRDDASYGEILAWSKLTGKACSAVDSGKYVSTALVATDMLYISEALGDEKLNYWGFSYGSVLGNTFAQMYPSRVGRMIVDGVADAEDYYEGKWLANLVNVDDVTQGFYDECSRSDKCVLQGSADEIRVTIEGLLDSLKSEPVIVFDGNATGLITYSTFKSAFFGQMYKPESWRKFAEHTAELLKGNGTNFFLNYGLTELKDESDDGGYATRCGDSIHSSYNVSSKEAFEHHMSQLDGLSNFWSENWTLFCEYTQEPVMLWDGPFERVDANMLLIGNTYDPVTPLVAARKMSQFYTNGIVLHQDGYGHCSLAQKSSCTTRKVREWLLNGILPANNTICATDDNIFESSGLALW